MLKIVLFCENLEAYIKTMHVLSKEHRSKSPAELHTEFSGGEKPISSMHEMIVFQSAFTTSERDQIWLLKQSSLTNKITLRCALKGAHIVICACSSLQSDFLDSVERTLNADPDLRDHWILQFVYDKQQRRVMNEVELLHSYSQADAKCNRRVDINFSDAVQEYQEFVNRPFLDIASAETKQRLTEQQALMSGITGSDHFKAIIEHKAQRHMQQQELAYQQHFDNVESVANQDLAALPENFRKLQANIRHLQEKYQALIASREEAYQTHEAHYAAQANDLLHQLPAEYLAKQKRLALGKSAVRSHEQLYDSFMQGHMAIIQGKWEIVQREAMELIQKNAERFVTKKSMNPFVKDTQINIPRFPLSLFQQGIAPVPVSGDQTRLSADQTIVDSSTIIKKLVTGTKKERSTGAPVCNLVSASNFRLAISRPMIPANIITGLNSISAEATRFGNLRNLIILRSEALRAQAWDANSPFMAWRRFIKDLKANHLKTQVYSAHEQWLGDMVEVERSDPMPLPIYKSSTTGDYWVCGWHGTPKADDFYRLGFKMMFSNEVGLYGRGHYTAIESSKSFTYAAGRYPDATRFKGDMLICASNFGKNPALLLDGMVCYQKLVNDCRDQVARDVSLPAYLSTLSRNNELSDKDKADGTKRVIREPFLRLVEQVPKIVLPSNTPGSGFGGGKQEQYEFITPIPPTIILKISAAQVG